MATGYGKDVSCTDVLVTGRYVTGWRLVSQACYRRLITQRGTLRSIARKDAGAYGFDVAGYIGAVGTETALRSLPGLVAGELRKDDRIASVSVTATASDEGAGRVAVTLEIRVSPEDEAGDFVLTMAASAVGVTLISEVAA